MDTAIGIADLKARLSEYIGRVRRGGAVTVLDRGTPVARIVPMTSDTLEIRRATRPIGSVPLPPPPSKPTDSLAILLEDRARR